MSAFRFLLALAAGLSTAAAAQIRTDGTLGAPAVALAGPNFLIAESLGRLSGSNLFHSFLTFSVGAGESATFATSTPGLANVVSRVTGGSASQINGLVRLASSDAAPNFFFVNPAGVVFGQGAQISVPAAFHVGTADYVKFPDGNFYADPARTSTLSAAAPEAFGFLGNSRATIEIRDRALLRTTSSLAGQPIDIVAGDVLIDNGQVQAVGGTIRVVAAGAGAQEIALSGPAPGATGNLAIVDGGYLFSAPGGSRTAGDIVVAAGNALVDGTHAGSGTLTGVLSQALPGSTGNTGRVEVTVADTLVVAGNGAIGTSTLTSGQSGAVAVGARTLAVANGGLIFSSTRADGAAGSVTVNAGDIAIDGGNGPAATGITSQTLGGRGDAGSIDVAVDGTLRLGNGGSILSDTFGAGKAGTIRVAARELIVAGGGGLGSSTFGAGDAGAITVSAGELTLDGVGGNAGLTAIATYAAYGSSGNAGSIAIDVSGKLSLVRGGEIISDTNASGRAGTIAVRADNIAIDSAGGDLLSGIFSTANPGSSGDAGNIAVSTPGRLALSNRGVISTGTLGGGRAGSVVVDAGFVSGDSHASIGATADPRTSGQTGTVVVRASEGLSLANGAVISITNQATVADPAALAPTRLSVAAPTITLSSGAQITAAASGNVAASNVEVAFGPNLTLSHATIATSAQDGNGGAIAVRGNGVLTLQDSQITTSVAGTQGNGGDIALAAPIMVMQTGFVQANTAAAAASGGDVNVEVASLLPSGSTLFVGGTTPYAFQPGVFGFNVIQAAAPTGVSGNIAISTPALDISGSLATLPAKFLDAGGPARSPCAIVGGSSLAQVGRGGMPLAAGGLLWLDPFDQTVAESAAAASGTAEPVAGEGAWIALAPCRAGAS
jgi:filamentous hemagglutinin family protein